MFPMISPLKTIKHLFLGTICVVVLFGFVVKANALTLIPDRFEFSGDPGQVIVKEMTIVNDTLDTQTYYPALWNFEAQGESGTPNLVQPKDGLGTWINVPNEVFLPPGISKIVPITITIPKDAEPGGYFSAVSWGASSGNATSTSTQVSINSKLGVLLLLTVNGDIKEAGGITEFNTADTHHYYESLPVAFTYRFRNDGGDRIKLDGNIVLRNIFGFTSALVPANKVAGNVLPNQTRRFGTTWVSSSKYAATEAVDVHGFFNKALYEFHNFAFGRYSATLDLSYGSKDLQKASAKTVVWIFPWQFLIVFIVSLAIVLYILRKIVRWYNGWVITQAENRMKAENKISQDSEIKNGPAA